MEMMMCEVVEAWSLPLFVGALLDLAAEFLLVRELASASCSLKFLPSFRLRLQCPCHGLYGRPMARGRCVWRDTGKRSDKTVVWRQVSAASMFPFCSHKGEGPTGDVNGGGSGARLDALKSGRPAVRSLEDLARCDNTLSCSSCDLQIAEAQAVCSPSSLERSCSNRAKSLTIPSRFSLGPDDVLTVEEGSRCNFMKAISGFGGTEKTEFETVDWANDLNTFWLAEESELMKRAACVGCASLLLELDKERNAAATATDKVISMIMQLQRQKVSAGMEAKQYCRVTQEKSAFDAAEMNILKVILLKSEREKHFSEMEVEAFWQIVHTNKRSENGLLEYDGVQKWTVSSSKADDVESMQTAGGNNGSNQDVKEKAAICLSDGGPLITNEPLSACCGLSLEIEEPLLPTERLGERNIDGNPANVFSDNTMDAHSDTFDISLNSSSSLVQLELP